MKASSQTNGESKMINKTDLTIDFDSMSYKLKVLLSRVLDSQLDGGHYDDRGYYAEYDCSDCKPYTHVTIMEAQELNFLIIHKDSDLSHEKEEDYYETQCIEDDEGEEHEEEVLIEDFVSGVSFITIKEEYLEQFKKHFEDESW